MSEKKKILYVLTNGIESPERAYSALILATAAATMGKDVTAYFIVKGVTLLTKREVEKIQLQDFPTLKEVIDKAVEVGVKLEVCEQSCMLLGLNKQDFVEAAKIVGALTLNDRILEADAVLSI